MREYGNPEESRDFQTLYRYSPLHRAQKGTHYPATMLLSADHDDRAVTFHSFKLAATLQQAQAAGKPILLLTLPGASHKRLQSSSWLDLKNSQLTFMIRSLKMEGVSLKEPRIGFKRQVRLQSFPVNIRSIENGHSYEYQPPEI